MAQVSFENVGKIYPDGTTAVVEFDLKIADGELMVLVGPSGCGKTTALRMVAGLEEVTSGEIMIGDEVINDLPPRERDVAMVFQNYALYPHKTVYENLAFPLKLRKMPKSEIDGRVKRAASLLELEDKLSRRPRQLSGGQRQRVAMGRAIVREPQAFLMDEPLSNLDAKLRTQMRAEISMLHKQLEATMIYVTHDQTEAMTLGERVAVMKHGELQQVGSPRDLYSMPANLFVAGFIGSPSMNFVEAELIESDDDVDVVFGSERIRVDEKERAECPALRGYLGRRIIAGFRPQSLYDASLSDGDGRERRLRGLVRLREDLGAEVVVHFEVEAMPVVSEDIREIVAAADEGAVDDAEHARERRRAAFVGRFPVESAASDGQQVEVDVGPGSLHFFDARTGVAIRD